MNAPLNSVNILVYKYGNTQQSILQAFANASLWVTKTKKTEIPVIQLDISAHKFFIFS